MLILEDSREIPDVSPEFYPVRFYQFTIPPFQLYQSWIALAKEVKINTTTVGRF
jgi:hypothetical protein